MEPSYNRCVHTIVGEPDAVIEATFRACAKAVELIDMNKHKGEHPRIGAIDASPFVPVKNVTLNDCVEYANRLGERVANELKVPVYLYEAAARKPERVKLQNIRHPEYEGLKDLIGLPEWKPDLGEAVMHPTAGAMPLGVRGPLVAFNISLSITIFYIAFTQSTQSVKLSQQVHLLGHQLQVCSYNFCICPPKQHYPYSEYCTV